MVEEIGSWVIEVSFTEVFSMMSDFDAPDSAKSSFF
jgi:hypothetical protein